MDSDVSYQETRFDLPPPTLRSKLTWELLSSVIAKITRRFVSPIIQHSNIHKDDTLFPYAYNAVESFVREHFEEAMMTEIIAEIRDVSERESKIDSNIRYS
ncbi:hypothetical protein KIN20_004691 [Parelaphostrongylus tenuis]|uniref:Uncharacterized protein n=1 Tax=Parelaphostrongylus tenuis TaxID=148309 RepID=A0AAD5M3H2_PARTN|nr:hypothetical protein KIN20_004691 [Parelaphostrongylus tenuis]